MAAKGSSTFSMDDLMKQGFWGDQRNRIIGVVVVIVLVVTGILVFREMGRAKETRGWSALVENGRLREHPPTDGPVDGTTAEPWALWLNARTAWDHEDFEQAESYLVTLSEQFPEHPLTTGPLPAFLEDVRKEIAWREEHKDRSGNPPVPDSRVVTLQTSVGPIEIGLYLDEAPVASREFLHLLRGKGAWKKPAFVSGREGAEVILGGVDDPDGDEGDVEGQDAGDDSSETPAGTESKDSGGDGGTTVEIDPSDLARGIVPDRNALSHYEGAVSFVRRFATGSDATPEVGIYLADNGGLDSRQVVFGQVQKGLDILKEIAKREKQEGNVRFAEPVVIESIDFGEELPVTD